MTERQPSKQALSHEAFLELCGLVIGKHWPRVTMNDLEKDKARLGSLDPFEQLVVRARWEKFVDLLLGLYQALEKYNSESGKLDLIC
jgi:hypothetical protein